MRNFSKKLKNFCFELPRSPIFRFFIEVSNSPFRLARSCMLVKKGIAHYNFNA